MRPPRESRPSPLWGSQSPGVQCLRLCVGSVHLTTKVTTINPLLQLPMSRSRTRLPQSERDGSPPVSPEDDTRLRGGGNTGESVNYLI